MKDMTMLETKQVFGRREATVLALDGQFEPREKSVEVTFPGQKSKRFSFQRGVEALDRYIQDWQEQYFRRLCEVAQGERLV